MKNINYKQLRKYSKLPKYDIGTKPIGSGYQRNADQVQLGYINQQAAPITNSFRETAKQEALSSLSKTALDYAPNFIKAYNAYKDAITSVGEEYSKKAATDAVISNSLQASKDAFYQEGLSAAKEAGKTAAGKALGAANIALNGYNALTGTIETFNNWNDSSTLGAGDLMNSASRSTQYANGVAYDTMGGYDITGVNKYVRAQNDASKMSGATSGMKAGMGIGGLVGLAGGPLGSIIGTGIGAVVGGLTGLFGGNKARRKREQKIREAKNNYMLAADAYNTQSESEAATQGLRNQYYATHGQAADMGLSVNHKNPNALIQGGEPVVKVNKKGSVIGADMFPITQYTPERVDNIPVKLDEGSTKDGVIGNKRNPYTGERLAVEARPWVMVLNDPNASKQQKELAKDQLKSYLDLQDNIPSNESFYADCGRSTKKNMKNRKCLRKCDSGFPQFFPTEPFDTGEPDIEYPKQIKKENKFKLPKINIGNLLQSVGGVQYPMMSYLNNYFANKAMQKDVENSKVHAYNSYSPNKVAGQAFAMMPTTYDITPQRNQLQDALRHGLYSAGQSGSSGMRQVAMNNLFNNYMKGISSLMSEKYNKENEMLANKAQLLYQLGETDANRSQQAYAAYYDQLSKATAAKNNQLMALKSTLPKDFDRFMQNLSNFRFGDKYLNMVYQKSSDSDKEIIKQLLGK